MNRRTQPKHMGGQGNQTIVLIMGFMVDRDSNSHGTPLEKVKGGKLLLCHISPQQ